MESPHVPSETNSMAKFAQAVAVGSMSIKVMSRIWEDGPDQTGERFVLLAISDFANDDGDAWPSLASIARKTCMTTRGVRLVLRKLEAEGWLETGIAEARAGCNKYRVVTPPPRNSVPPGTQFPPELHDTTPGTQFPPPRNSTTLPPELSSPEPSRTIIEP